MLIKLYRELQRYDRWRVYTFPNLYQGLLLSAKYKILPTYRKVLKRAYILFKLEEVKDETTNHNGSSNK